jgi:hypothetical protein
VAVLACTPLLACGGSASQSRAASRTPAAPPTTTIASTTTAAATSTTRRRPRRPRPSPGSLPQTDQFPTADTARFRAEIAALWAGVRTGKVRPALPAFFPEGAYAQVKAVVDPDADYEDRLVSEYDLDIGAAHALLGAHARAAELVGTDVPSSYGHWIPPDACYNRIGYYEVPNSRIVYREDGQVRSFGIASMISWRGVWYVVHLGAVTRSSDTGVVDDPGTGRGAPAASATC